MQPERHDMGFVSAKPCSRPTAARCRVRRRSKTEPNYATYNQSTSQGSFGSGKTLQARVFQANRCALSGAPLELPAVHFLCGHSFNGARATNAGLRQTSSRRIWAGEMLHDLAVILRSWPQGTACAATPSTVSPQAPCLFC